MNATHELFGRASAWLWPWLAGHLWQAALFAGLVFFLTLGLRRGPARLRHSLWLVASAKFVLPSALFAWLAVAAGVDASALFGGGHAEQPAPLAFQIVAGPLAQAGASAAQAAEGARHGELYCALTLLWLAGSLALACVWLRRRRAFVKGLRGGRESYAGREFEALERARARLGLKLDARLVLSEGRVGPGVWRTLRPVVVLPEEMAGQLDDEELEAVLLHELAHAERRDNLWSNMQAGLACVFWFHPVVWLVGRALLAERERACDERVLESGGQAGAYASGILKVVRFCSGWSLAGVAGAAAGSNLRRRIESIMRGNEQTKTRTLYRLLPASAAAAALAFTALAGLSGAGPSALAQQAGGAARGGGGEDGNKAITIQAVRPARAGRSAPREQGPAVQEITSAPESMVYFGDVVPGAPVAITDARMRLVTRDQLRRADEEGADFFDEEEQSDFYLTLPSVTLANFSAREIKEVGVGFLKGGKTRVIMGFATSMRPGESQTFRSEWSGRNVIMPGTLADVSLRVAWVTFTDGTTWGGLPRPPQAPAAPPAPGSATGSGRAARARTQAGDAVEGDQEEVEEGVPAQAEGGGRARAKAIELPQPSYPAIAKAARAEGEVSVRITVDESGRVVSASAVSGHPLLQQAAVAAAREARFEPTTVNGRPVRVSATLSYRFALSNEEKKEGPQE